MTQHKTGPIVIQKRCSVIEGDSAESLKTRVQALEGSAMIEAIQKFSRDEIGPAASLPILTYRSVGVDIDASDKFVEMILKNHFVTIFCAGRRFLIFVAIEKHMLDKVRFGPLP